MEKENEAFSFQDNEKYDKLCGEILLTTFGRLAFQCTLCDEVYSGFDNFFGHLYDQHLTSSEYLEEKIEFEKAELSCNFDSIHDIEQDDQKEYVEIEIEAVEDAIVLEEEEIFINLPQNVEQNTIKPQIKKEKIQKKSKTVTANAKLAKEIVKDASKEEIIDELPIPDEIREVKKRTLRGPNLTPAEERKYKCPICGLAFKERHNMRHHFRRHSNERNHKCPQCEKRFYTSTEVRIHLQFHTRERRYLCSDCGRSFLTKSHLTSHSKRHRNERDFKCTLCERAFYSSGQLSSHMRGHSNERPFGCKLCTAAFSRKTALANHIKLHENKREYKCTVCDAGFNQKAGLFSHIKTTHKKG